MIKKSLALWMIASVLSLPCVADDKASGPNVILLTLDGVRWEEVFQGVDQGQSLDANPRIFDFLLNHLSNYGVLYGDRTKGETVTVGNRFQNSLPGYQSIMAGAAQPCTSNSCGRITTETFPERLARELKLQPEQVATIASWERIALAVEHQAGGTFVNTGNTPMPVAAGLGINADKTNGAQAGDTPPWKDARYDKYTFAHAMSYLQEKKPRFLFIGLNDTDEWGHKGNYTNYLSSLREYDERIKSLVNTLEQLGEYGRRTTLIITTDHGRGEGNDWNEHGSGYPGSKYVWLYGSSPATRAAANAPAKAKRVPSAKNVFSHLDIRPTIEAIFGLKPLTGNSRGKVIAGITGQAK
jgi:hypothetical protein